MFFRLFTFARNFLLAALRGHAFYGAGSRPLGHTVGAFRLHTAGVFFAEDADVASGLMLIPHERIYFLFMA